MIQVHMMLPKMAFSLLMQIATLVAVEHVVAVHFEFALGID